MKDRSLLYRLLDEHNWKITATNGGHDYRGVYLQNVSSGGMFVSDVDCYYYEIIADGNEKSRGEWVSWKVPNGISFTQEDYNNALKNEEFNFMGLHFYL